MAGDTPSQNPGPRDVGPQTGPTASGAADGPGAEGSPAPEASDRTRSILSRLEKFGLTREFGAVAFAPFVAAVATLWLVLPTLAPGVANWDTAEFQTVLPTMGTAHPTGYPAYVILGWLASCILQPFGDPAFRVNLLQALLAAGAVACAVAIVQYLTGMRWIALATGLLLAWTQLFWRMSTHADPHMFHVALVGLIFLLLLAWERRRTSPDPDVRARSNRWIIAAAIVYGVAVANHSLALLLPPAIGLFILAVAPRILLEWRLVATLFAALAATVLLFWLELPIRAAMNAPLVYGHPDTWSGFWYVVMGQQFGGSLNQPWDDLGRKAGDTVALISGWVGPLGYFAAVGIGTSLVRRPRYLLLSGVALLATCWFAASYANADIGRYYLVPLFVVFTWIGLGIADAISVVVWAVTGALAATAGGATDAAAPGATAASGATAATAGAPSASPGGGSSSWQMPALLAVEAVVAVALIVANVTIVPERQHVPDGDHPGAVSEADQTWDAQWVQSVLAPADQGGLPANSVIVGWWSDSTKLWYGQKVLGLRPDIYIVDDSMRVKAGDNLGDVWTVIDSYLGRRPVFVDRLSGGCDGTDVLKTMYSMSDFALPNGVSILQVADIPRTVKGNC